MKPEREIWFHRILWGYMPIHWKGFATLAAIIVPTIFGIFFGQWFLRTIGIEGADDWPFLLILPASVIGLIVAERHS